MNESKAKRKRARWTLWALRLLTPGFGALEPSIRSEAVVLEQERLDKEEGKVDASDPEDPYGIRKVKNCLFEWFLFIKRDK